MHRLVRSVSVPSLLAGLLLGVVVMGLWARLSPFGGDAQALRTFRAAFELTRDRYVDTRQTGSTELVYDAIQGMIEGLGDTGHSRFLTPEQRQREAQQLTGELVGIGVEVAERDGHPVVVAPLPGSPAARAGIRPGDRFLRIDGEDVSNLPLSELSARIRGQAGTTVRLTVLHPDDTTAEFTLRREEIHIPSVTWAPLADSTLWHIHISRFGDDTSDELGRSLDAARQAGATGIVLDLRDNPGGLLNEAVEVVSRFVHEGVVLIEQGRQGDREEIRVDGDVPTVDTLLVVLINGGSASASEVVAAALKEHQRAATVGTRTFGTGTILREFTLPDGSALLLGVQEWLTPTGQPLRATGVTPDAAVELPAEVEPVIPDRPAAPAEQPCASHDAQLVAAATRLGLRCAA